MKGAGIGTTPFVVRRLILREDVKVHAGLLLSGLRRLYTR